MYIFSYILSSTNSPKPWPNLVVVPCIEHAWLKHKSLLLATAKVCAHSTSSITPNAQCQSQLICMSMSSFHQSLSFTTGGGATRPASCSKQLALNKHLKDHIPPLSCLLLTTRVLLYATLLLHEQY